ncbi:MAG: hypothetical protein L0154_09630 [Chloroflexi bacterium]|nr:hypothetical protein [Chloroflexota bacterium]
MLKRLILLLLCTLLFASPILAQEDQQFTSEDGQVTFTYPSDWFVVEDEQGDFIVSNAELTEEQIASGVFDQELDEDQIFLVISVYDPQRQPEGQFVVPNGPPLFLLGFYSGLFSFIFSPGFGSAAIVTFEEPELVTVNDIEFAVGRLSITEAGETSYVAIITSLLDDNVHLATSLAGSVDSLDNFLETALEIVSTVEYSPQE